MLIGKKKKKGVYQQKKGLWGSLGYPENTAQRAVLLRESVLWVLSRVHSDQWPSLPLRGARVPCLGKRCGEKGREVQLHCQERREGKDRARPAGAAMDALVGSSEDWR